MSATAPASSENIKMGSAVAVCTSATMCGELASSVIIQEAPVDWIRLPKLDTRLAVHSAANSGWRSGAKLLVPRMAAKRDAPGTLGIMLMVSPDSHAKARFGRPDG